MATMNFSIPDDVKEAFNKAFEGENKSAVITRLMRQGHRRGGAQSALAGIGRAAAANQGQQPRPMTDDEIRRAREE